MKGKLIVYLDQNQWIKLARLEHGKDVSDNDLKILSQARSALSLGYSFPISSYHLMEFARIRDEERRRKLGSIMWKYSNGLSVSSPQEILSHEIEVSLNKLGLDLNVRNFQYLKRGFFQTIEVDFEDLGIPIYESKKVDEAMLCGYGEIPPIYGVPNSFRENFLELQKRIRINSHKFCDYEIEIYLYALCMLEIKNPFKAVIQLHKLE